MDKEPETSDYYGLCVVQSNGPHHEAPGVCTYNYYSVEMDPL